jgi:hypothetical protein
VTRVRQGRRLASMCACCPPSVTQPVDSSSCLACRISSPKTARKARWQCPHREDEGAPHNGPRARAAPTGARARSHRASPPTGVSVIRKRRRSVAGSWGPRTHRSTHPFHCSTRFSSGSVGKVIRMIDTIVGWLGWAGLGLVLLFFGWRWMWNRRGHIASRSTRGRRRTATANK